MKLLITGGKGFIGNYLRQYYAEYGYHVFAPPHIELDLTNADEVRAYLAAHRFGAVIHCALYGRDNVKGDDSRNYTINRTMYENIRNNREYFGKFINIGTGFEYDPDRSIEYADEDDILYVEPKNPYASVKNYISRDCRKYDNFHTLRLFGVAHYTEPKSTFFGKLNQSQNSVFEIDQDRNYDFFNLEDLPTVITSVLEKKITDRDINCVYENKYKLSQLAKMFCDVKNIPSNIVIKNQEMGKSYTGDNTKLAAYNLPFLGLELAMLRY